MKSNYPEAVNTDVEIWREATAYRTALIASGPREVARYTVREGGFTKPKPTTQVIPPSEPSKETVSGCENLDEPENETDSKCFY